MSRLVTQELYVLSSCFSLKQRLSVKRKLTKGLFGGTSADDSLYVAALSKTTGTPTAYVQEPVG